MNLINLISFGVTPVVSSLNFTVYFRTSLSEKSEFNDGNMCDVLENVADESQILIDVLSIVSSI